MAHRDGTYWASLSYFLLVLWQRTPIMRTSNFLRSVIRLLAIICIVTLPRQDVSASDMKTTGYREPDKKIVKILDTPNTPQMSVSPSGDIALLIEYTSMLTLENLAEPQAKLAGLRIMTRYNIQKRSYYVQNLKVLDLKTKAIKEIKLPENAKFGFPIWSPNGKLFAAALYKAGGSSVWLFDPAKGTGKQISPARLNSILYGPFWWSHDNKSIFVPLWHEKRGAPPVAPVIPETPEIQETSGTVAPVRTYQDLLQSSYDERLFEYYATSQLHKIDIRTGKCTKFGTAGLINHVSISPDQKYSVAKILEPPFSHAVPYNKFAHRLELWDSKGKLIKILAHIPVGENIPIEGVREGMRNIFWQKMRPSTLCWTEALDGGNPNNKAEFRDVLKALEPPFSDEPREIIKLPQRFEGFEHLDKQDLCLIWDYDRDTKWTQARVINMSQNNIASECKTLFGRNSRDNYNNPGEIIYYYNPKGETTAILENEEWIYLEGQGASPEGNRPFLRKFNINTGETKEIFRAGTDVYESFLDFADSDRKYIVTVREDKETSPNYFKRRVVRDRAKEPETLTEYEAPTKEFAKVRKELIKYKREDGVPLSGTLYYPIDYKPGKRYPAIIWAYPREYTDVATAGQVRSSSNRYTRIGGSSILFFLLRGYVVLYNAEIPVVGDPLTANDNYIQQITMGAEAAVNKLVELGVTERDTIGVAGHSYGAFMVANLLAHTDLFAAGIARSGAYNRTLTPFGFQGERRTYWEAKDIYTQMSPFAHADKIKTPILLIHGEDDPNSGTFPIQSERLYAAIKGHGGTARLVILPHESHGYEARESILHVLAEQFDWFDRFVKK